ncbi:MAG: bifunctional 2-keto-4-hydroxyglutarate aldolase/2-keto-3-deoxy-6-phosphogluconate aldolase [Planctomycetota bacterium]|nr:MAG: bifunctional 2-keto-4-hydroxyglutarate aldolase/2-keto-3-deoxy-6-phosphogluconate aldolase [Planctomycetota bacterium]
MEPQAFLQALWQQRASAILRTGERERARRAMEAAVAGGFRIVEFTLTTPGALELIAAFSRRDELIVGAGTVLAPEQARAAVAAGARFLVSPVVDEAVIAAARALGVAVVPGGQTPTELWRAHALGAPLLKLFPAPAGGPAWLRAVLGPLPGLRVMPTHGVEPDNAAAWLEAGAFAVGFTSSLFDPEVLAAGAFEAVTERARRCLAAVRGLARPPRPPC